MKRILFVDHTPFSGGAQLVLAEHIRHLDRTRFTPLVACTDAAPDLVQLYRDVGAEVHVLPLPRLRGLSVRALPRLLGAVRRLRRLVRTERADLVVSNTSRAAYLSSLALLGRATPLVWWVRDFLYSRLWFRLLRRRPARIVCVSAAIRDFYGGASDPRYRIVFVGNGLHAELDALAPARIDEERARWGFGADDVVVGFMGRLVADKGVQDVIRAVELVHKDDRRVKLLIVGTGSGQEGDVEQQVRDHVDRAGLTFVRFAGYQADQALYYSVFDLFAMSARAPEAMSTSIVQAMMAGKPVVSTATGGNSEIVLDGETGLLVPPGDPAVLAAAIRRLLHDPDLASALAAAGRDRAMRLHREEDVTAQVERVYDEVLGR